jgi:F-type H+-transporting ATPase subunit epsilon
MVAEIPRELRCVVVTPEKAVVDAPADYVMLPMYDGALGVLPGRAPLVGRLGFGELVIRNGAQSQRYFVDGGFAQVVGGAVTVLTARALKPEEIKPADAEQALEAAREAQAAAHTPEAQDANLKAMQRARVQLRIVARLREESRGTHGHA